jgi:hypothetical protein
MLKTAAIANAAAPHTHLAACRHHQPRHHLAPLIQLEHLGVGGRRGGPIKVHKVTRLAALCNVK